jgi:hypothetical protein
MTKLKLILTALIIAGTTVSGSHLMALDQQNRISPHETISSVVDGNQITIVYGRPRSRDPKTGESRKIWGTLVPYGKVWRTGADEATLFTTQQPIVMGGTTIPAGTYSLFTLPDKNGTAKLIVNKQVGQWGTSYNKELDFARIDLEKENLTEPVDQFTMAIKKLSSGVGVVEMMWESTRFLVGFTVTTSRQ